MFDFFSGLYSLLIRLSTTIYRVNLRIRKFQLLQSITTVITNKILIYLTGLIEVMPIRKELNFLKIENCCLQTYSPSYLRKRRSLTVPLLSQINEETEINSNHNNNKEVIKTRRNNDKIKILSHKNDALIEKVNHEKFPEHLFILPNSEMQPKQEEIKILLNGKSKVQRQNTRGFKLERIPSGELLDTDRTRSYSV